MNIVLIGMKYTGKSTVGRQLAWRLGAEFRDTDDVMVEIFARRTGQNKPLREILPEKGVVFFNGLEADAAREILSEINSAGEKVFVVSLGGRCPLNEAAMEYISQIGPVVYLQNSSKILLERLAKAPKPSFLSDEDPEKQFLDIYNSRKGVYEQKADITVAADGLDVPAVVNAVEQAISKI